MGTLVLIAAASALGCDTNQSPDVLSPRSDDGGSCPAYTWRLFATAGCGEQAEPVCVSPSVGYDPVPACSCSGHTVTSWSIGFGPIGTFTSEPIAHFGACADGDTPDEPEPDAAIACVAPYIATYRSPGCGAAAHPVCAPPIDTSCLQPRCSCTGETIAACSFTLEPFAHGGTCEDGGDAQSP